MASVPIEVRVSGEASDIVAAVEDGAVDLSGELGSVRINDGLGLTDDTCTIGFTTQLPQPGRRDVVFLTVEGVAFGGYLVESVEGDSIMDTSTLTARRAWDPLETAQAVRDRLESDLASLVGADEELAAWDASLRRTEGGGLPGLALERIDEAGEILDYSSLVSELEDLALTVAVVGEEHVVVPVGSRLPTAPLEVSREDCQAASWDIPEAPNSPGRHIDRLISARYVTEQVVVRGTRTPEVALSREHSTETRAIIAIEARRRLLRLQSMTAGVTIDGDPRIRPRRAVTTAAGLFPAVRSWTVQTVTHTIGDGYETELLLIPH